MGPPYVNLAPMRPVKRLLTLPKLADGVYRILACPAVEGADQTCMVSRNRLWIISQPELTDK